MRVSVLTATLNSEGTIKQALESCVNQDYEDIEYIIVDGGSTDQTLNIIDFYAQKVDKLIVGKDKNLYDALNKGIEAADGDLICLLHSDDYFFSNQVIRKVVEKIERDDLDCCYSDLVMVHKDEGYTVRKWQAGTFSRLKFYAGWMPPHPTICMKREVFFDGRFYRTDFGSASDYEWILRSIFKTNIKVGYLNETTYVQRTGGLSNRNITARVKAHFSDWKAWRMNTKSILPIWVLLKPLRKLFQFRYMNRRSP
ncbi:glycosyltransferase [Gammaproteobacteria bacterium]|nr:glycosyltransferase [Gammaproteobacteria bacterium]